MYKSKQPYREKKCSPDLEIRMQYKIKIRKPYVVIIEKIEKKQILIFQQTTEYLKNVKKKGRNI